MLRLKTILVIVCMACLMIALASGQTKGKGLNKCPRDAKLLDKCNKTSGEQGVCLPRKNCQGKCRLKCLDALECCSDTLPDDPNHGKWVPAENSKVNTLAFLDCNEGYYVYGGRGCVQCHSNGTWSSSTAYCEPIKCSDEGLPEDPDHGTWAPVDDNKVNTVACLECEEGYYVKGCSECVHCHPNGSWSSSDAYCEPIKCSDECLPENPDNGKWVPVADSKVNTLAYLDCEDGYFVVCDLGCVQCDSNGTWSSSTAYCEPINCGASSCPDYLLVLDVDGESFVGSTASILCLHGYKPGYNNVKCLTNGTWDIPEDTCSVPPVPH